MGYGNDGKRDIKQWDGMGLDVGCGGCRWDGIWEGWEDNYKTMGCGWDGMWEQGMGFGGRMAYMIWDGLDGKYSTTGYMGIDGKLTGYKYG